MDKTGDGATTAGAVGSTEGGAMTARTASWITSDAASNDSTAGCGDATTGQASGSSFAEETAGVVIRRCDAGLVAIYPSVWLQPRFVRCNI